MRNHDYLDISLHDADLHTEVELMVRLIVAANQTDQALPTPDVDQILEVRHAAAGPPEPPEAHPRHVERHKVRAVLSPPPLGSAPGRTAGPTGATAASPSG